MADQETGLRRGAFPTAEGWGSTYLAKQGNSQLGFYGALWRLKDVKKYLKFYIFQHNK